MTEKELKNQILILLDSFNDIETKDILRKNFEKLKTRKEMEDMLECLVNDQFNMNVF